MSQTRTAAATSATAPLRIAVFRWLWIGALVSNIGTWMQTVGAQWLLVREPGAAALVSLVQTAQALPVLLLALPAGVLADTFDRRRMLITIQAFQTGIALLLTVLTVMDQMQPTLLLLLTFALGVGAAVQAPAYQALIPDLVPTEQIPSASILGSINVNTARAIGPAVAGLIVARFGVPVTFALNAASFVAFAVILLGWRRPETDSAGQEPFLPALRAGGRYVRNALVVRRILLRCALFVFPANALWALLALVADRTLHLGAGGYGLMLAMLGIGSVLGAFGLSRLRTYLNSNGMIAVASIVYAAGLAALVLVPNAVVAMLALLPMGACWIAVLSTLNAQMQIFLPGWVRARGLAIYQLTLFGSMAGAGVLWGIVAEISGVRPTYLAAAALLLLSAASVRLWPLRDLQGIDRSAALIWPEPHLLLEPEDYPGQVLVVTRYEVAPERQAEFLGLMPALRRSRLRTGGTSWQLYRDGEAPNRFLEEYTVASWAEHLLQHEGRLTGYDGEIDRRAKSLSDPPVRAWHYFTPSLPKDG